MSQHASGQQAASSEEEEERDLHTVAGLVFLRLPLSVQAITLPALSKWQQWARDQHAKERTLQEAEREWPVRLSFTILKKIAMFHVPLWAAQQRQRSLYEPSQRSAL